MILPTTFELLPVSSSVFDACGSECKVWRRHEYKSQGITDCLTHACSLSLSHTQTVQCLLLVSYATVPVHLVCHFIGFLQKVNH